MAELIVAPRRVGAAADDLRGSARRVPVGRRRFERGRRDDGGPSAEPVNTCSIAFADPAYDESRFAQQVAERYRTRHFVDRVESDDFDLIDELARLYDEPYADSSAIPTYRVCQLARKHVTVALSGDGGDESFGGYRRYRLHLAEERMRRTMPLVVARARCSACSAASIRRPTGRRASCAPRRRSRRSARDSVEAYFHSMSILPRRHAPARCSRPRSRRDSAATTRSRCSAAMPRCARTDDPLALIQYLDLKTYLVGDINTKVDRAQHGAFARGARAADGPSAGRVAGDAAFVAEGARQRRQVAAQEGHGAAPAAATSSIGRRWASRCRWHAGSAGRCGSASASALLGDCLAETGFFDAGTCVNWSTSTSRAGATTARRCGRC